MSSSDYSSESDDYTFFAGGNKVEDAYKPQVAVAAVVEEDSEDDDFGKTISAGVARANKALDGGGEGASPKDGEKEKDSLGEGVEAKSSLDVLMDDSSEEDDDEGFLKALLSSHSTDSAALAAARAVPDAKKEEARRKREITKLRKQLKEYSYYSCSEEEVIVIVDNITRMTDSSGRRRSTRSRKTPEEAEKARQASVADIRKATRSMRGHRSKTLPSVLMMDSDEGEDGDGEGSSSAPLTWRKMVRKPRRRRTKQTKRDAVVAAVEAAGGAPLPKRQVGPSAEDKAFSERIRAGLLATKQKQHAAMMEAESRFRVALAEEEDQEEGYVNERELIASVAKSLADNSTSADSSFMVVVRGPAGVLEGGKDGVKISVSGETTFHELLSLTLPHRLPLHAGASRTRFHFSLDGESMDPKSTMEDEDLEEDMLVELKFQGF